MFWAAAGLLRCVCAIGEKTVIRSMEADDDWAEHPDPVRLLWQRVDKAFPSDR